MPRNSEYLKALEETVGADYFELALRELVMARSFLNNEKTKELENCRNNDDRSALLIKWFKDFLTPEVRNFIVLLVEAKKLQLLHEIEISSAQQKVVVTLASEPSPSLQSSLKKELSSIVDGALVTFKINPKILGGVKIKIGDREVDNSILKRLKVYAA